MRIGFGLGVAYNTPWYFYKQLTGVVWNCPDCGTEAVVVMRRRRHINYWFYCKNTKNALYNFYTPDAENLVQQLRNS